MGLFLRRVRPSGLPLLLQVRRRGLLHPRLVPLAPAQLTALGLQGRAGGSLRLDGRLVVVVPIDQRAERLLRPSSRFKRA